MLRTEWKYLFCTVHKFAHQGSRNLEKIFRTLININLYIIINYSHRSSKFLGIIGGQSTNYSSDLGNRFAYPLNQNVTNARLEMKVRFNLCYYAISYYPKRIVNDNIKYRYTLLDLCPWFRKENKSRKNTKKKQN